MDILFVVSFIFVGFYTLSLGLLMVYGLHRYWILYLYWRWHKKPKKIEIKMVGPSPLPVVTIQLPVFNEMYVVERLLDSVSRLDYPKERLEIQLLDDSDDQTIDIAQRKVEMLQKEGYHVSHIRRGTRQGFKAGALNHGLKFSQGEFVAIFDADFIPPVGFLKAVLPYFSDPMVGMVQTRWGHLNANYSLLTRLQSLFLDGHFLLEHTARYKSGAFFNFNGTAGIWRRSTIDSVGGWSTRSLTEDLDLSYRAQLAGWKFVFVPEFVCPAELPVDIHAFRSQQRRWTKGAIQVARCLLKDLWKASIPLHTKFEATAHLTANIGYFLMVIVAILFLPSLILRQNLPWRGASIFEAIAFFVTFLSVTLFYAVSQRDLYPDWKWRMRDICALMSFGIGMCVINASAVWEGLQGKPSEFIRTPKYNVTSKSDSWTQKRYINREKGAWFIQGFFALYSIATLVTAAYLKYWFAVPFIFLFVFGFSYIAGLSLLHRPALR